MGCCGKLHIVAYWVSSPCMCAAVVKYMKYMLDIGWIVCYNNLQRCVRLCFLDKTTEFWQNMFDYTLSSIVVNFINISTKQNHIMQSNKWWQPVLTVVLWYTLFECNIYMKLYHGTQCLVTRCSEILLLMTALSFLIEENSLTLVNAKRNVVWKCYYS